MSQSEHIKLGYLREPESHEMFFPYTHAQAIIGLSSKLSEVLHPVTINLDGNSRVVYAPEGWGSALESVALQNLQGPISGNLTGYLKRIYDTTSGVYGWELDPYGGGAKEAVMNDGSIITTTTTATAGLRRQTGTNSYDYQKISFASIVNDTSTGTNAVSIILNGNFS